MATESVTKAVESNRARLMAQVRKEIPVIDHVRNAHEVEFLKLYREANEVDKKRILKLARAAIAGKLPSAEERSAMTLEQVSTFADSLPEAFA